MDEFTQLVAYFLRLHINIELPEMQRTVPGYGIVRASRERARSVLWTNRYLIEDLIFVEYIGSEVVLSLKRFAAKD